MARKSTKNGLAGRIAGLKALLQKDRPTSNATRYVEWKDAFSLDVPCESYGQMTKIEGWTDLVAGSRVDHNKLTTRLTFSLPFKPSFIMSSTVASSASSSSISNETILALVSQMAETNKLLLRLLLVQGTAAGLDMSDLKPDGAKGKGKGKAKASRPKIVAPAAAAGVIRFGSKKEGDYTEFSHMFESPVKLDGKDYASVAHYINSVKYLDPAKAGVADDAGNVKAENIRNEKNAGKVRVMGLGKEHTRPDWDSVRVGLLKKALLAKFSSHSALKDKLLATGDALLEDSNQDDFWGIGKDGKGANQAGVALMQVRAELGGKPVPTPTAPAPASAGAASAASKPAAAPKPAATKPAARARVVPNPPKLTQSTQPVESDSEDEEEDEE